MVFTPEQEQEIIQKNMPKIYRAVDNFTARRSFVQVPYEDFVQEVSLAYLCYIRKCETQEELAVFPWFTAMGAMRDLVFKFQPMSVPKSQHRFSEIIHSMPITMSWDVIKASAMIDVDGTSKHWIDDIETKIDFDMFMSGQTEYMRRISAMRIYGMTLKEIGEQCGVTKGAIQQRFDKLYDSYKEYEENSKNEDELH